MNKLEDRIQELEGRCEQLEKVLILILGVRRDDFAHLDAEFRQILASFYDEKRYLL